MASAAAAITAALSSLSVRPLPRRGLVLKPLQTISLSSSSYSARLRTLPKLAAKGDADTSSFDDIDPEDDDIPLPDFDKLPPETNEEIAAAYEELYGPAYSGVSVLGNDINIMDRKLRASRRSQEVLVRPEDGIEERLVQSRRVTKVVKGGMNINFRAVVVVGDMQGHVGVGVGKAGDSDDAIIKASINGRRNMITVPLTKHNSFPHRADGKYGAAEVMLRPARPGSGVIAGGAVRDVLELAGIQNAMGKQLGSKNPLNNARATLAAIKKMRLVEDIARERGVSVQYLLGRE